jgi:type IV pilus assembly protein PilB
MQISDRNLERYIEKYDILGPAQLAEAKLEIARTLKNPPSLQNVLLNLGYVSEDTLIKIYSQEINVASVSLEELSPDPAIVTLIPEELAIEKGCLALEMRGTQLVVAMQDPNDLNTLDELNRFVKAPVLPLLASRGAIRKKLTEYHDHYKIHLVEHMMQGVKDQGRELTQQLGLNVQSLTAVTDQAPVVKAVNLILIGALLKRASDIHLVPDKRYLRAKYRVDGILQEEQALNIADAGAIVSRIKIMAKLDIAEKRMPQDGTFQISIEGREIDFRVATAPTIFGEKVVMRVLDKSGLLLGLDHLGFDPEELKEFKRLIHKPHGIILIVGPTGSGKTTTLYSALDILNTGDKNISTVEDPVEYKIEGLTQIQVHSDIGLNFAAVLRSLLRQDPDIILVGEVRDLETTEIAIRAALTGHLVFATLHTNDAAGAIARLTEMGAEPYLIASALRCAMSQRLVRNVCSQCRESYPAPPEVAARLDPHGRHEGPLLLYRGKGCRHCFMTGYRGRSVISELLVVSEEVKRRVLARSTSAEIEAAARKDGMRTMYEDGIDKVLRGITSLEEVLKSTEDTQ